MAGSEIPELAMGVSIDGGFSIAIFDVFLKMKFEVPQIGQQMVVSWDFMRISPNKRNEPSGND